MARHEAIVREDGRESRKSGEPGIRGEQQDDRGRDLDDVVEGRARANDRLRHHAVDGFLLFEVRLYPDGRREPGDREKDRREDRAHEHQGLDRVCRLWPPEARHAVGHRLAARESDGARRERPKNEQKRQWRGSIRRERVWWGQVRWRIARHYPEEAERDQSVHRDHVRVRWRREEKPRLAYASQVADDEHGDKDESG